MEITPKDLEILEHNCPVIERQIVKTDIEPAETKDSPRRENLLDTL